MAAAPLVAWLYGTPTCVIGSTAGGVTAAAHPEAVGRWGSGSRVLSVTRPLTAGRSIASSEVVTRWFDNLLPEIGRPEIAAVHGTTTRLFDLLGAIGGESAGALVISPEGVDGAEREVPQYQPVGLDEIAGLVRELPRRPFGDDGRLRSSLAGVQGKLLLLKAADGTWSLPLAGSPSSHIMKPEPLDVPFGSSANEAVCTALARRCDLTQCNSDLVQLPGGRLAFVTERYDRRRSESGRLQRIHQEDMCQALDRAPGAKYEARGERLLTAVARLLMRHATVDDVRRLLAHTTFHVAIGNADAHAKNISFVHSDDGTIALAPIYDVANTVLDPARTAEPAMWINGVASIHAVTIADLEAEARAWGLRGADARAVVERTLRTIQVELPRAADGIWMPRDEDELLSSIDTRVLNLLAGLEAQQG